MQLVSSLGKHLNLVLHQDASLLNLLLHGFLQCCISAMSTGTPEPLTMCAPLSRVVILSTSFAVFFCVCVCVRLECVISSAVDIFLPHCHRLRVVQTLVEGPAMHGKRQRWSIRALVCMQLVCRVHGDRARARQEHGHQTLAAILQSPAPRLLRQPCRAFAGAGLG